MRSGGPRRAPTRVVGVLLVAALALLATACSGSGAPPASSLASQATPDLWNPCDPLSADLVSRLFAEQATRSTKTVDGDQECRFTPTTDGDPALNANYSLVPGTLDELIATFGAGKGTKIVTADVPRSDGARLIVHVGRSTLAVSGFVKNAQLVQAINVVAPRPFNRRQIVDGATALLRTMAAHADESGLTTSTARPSPSPSPTSSPTARRPTTPSAPASP